MLAGTEGYSSSHFKIELISTTLKNLSHERAPALRPFFSPRVKKVPTYQKDPWDASWHLRSCKLWVNLCGCWVFSCLCPLSMGKHFLGPAFDYNLQLQKYAGACGGKGIILAIQKCFHPLLSIAYDHSWGKTDLSSQIHQTEQHHEAFLWFCTFFASAELAFFSNMVDTRFWNFDALKFLCRQNAINYCSSFGVTILSKEPFFTPLISLITSSFIHIYTSWKCLLEHAVNYSEWNYLFRLIIFWWCLLLEEAG